MNFPAVSLLLSVSFSGLLVQWILRMFRRKAKLVLKYHGDTTPGIVEQWHRALMPKMEWIVTPVTKPTRMILPRSITTPTRSP